MNIKLELSQEQISMILKALFLTARDMSYQDLEKSKKYADLEAEIELIRHHQWVEKIKEA